MNMLTNKMLCALLKIALDQINGIDEVISSDKDNELIFYTEDDRRMLLSFKEIK